MKRNEQIDLSIPHRQSEYAIILILAKFARNFVRQAWPLLLIFIFSRKDFLTIWFALFFIMIAGFSLVASIIAYYKFFYYIKGDELHIEKGVFRKTHINVPFGRIQSIDFQQNVLHQLLGVVSLKVDTAGSKKSEIEFDALSNDQAEILRNYILRQKKKTVLTKSTDAEEILKNPEKEELLLHLTPLDLIKVGVSQNHLRTGGIILAFAFGILENVDQALPFDIFSKVNEEAEMWIRGSFIAILILVPLFLILSFLITLVRTTLKYYNLRFYQTGKGFKLISGLLNRNENTAQIVKIQLFSWSTNPIQKLFRIFTLRLYKADSADVIGEKSITVPGCYQVHIDKVREMIFPREAGTEYMEHRMHLLQLVRFILLAGVAPCIGITILGYILGSPLLFWVWLYFPVSILMGFLFHKKRAILMHQDYLISRLGIFGISYKLLENYKIQSVSLYQGFFQRRRDLANLHVFTASGSIAFRYLPVDKAKAIYDYLIYRVEIDHREWM